MMAATERANISGANSTEADGNIGSEKRRKPYPPIFKRMAARMTEPAVGASTWASGSQVWTGHIGNFTANDARNANHAHFCRPIGNPWRSKAAISVVPASQYIAIIASSISTEPSSVQRKNLKL